MFKKNKSHSDIRYKILLKLNENAGTEEFKNNAFLMGLHKDLGVLKRALIELCDNGYVLMSNGTKESSVKWLKTQIITANSPDDTAQDKLDKKSSKRLIEKVGRFERIKTIPIYITLNGINAITERDTIVNYNWYVRYNWLTLIFAAIIGSGATFLFSNLKSCKGDMKEGENTINTSEKAEHRALPIKVDSTSLPDSAECNE